MKPEIDSGRGRRAREEAAAKEQLAQREAKARRRWCAPRGGSVPVLLGPMATNSWRPATSQPRGRAVKVGAKAREQATGGAKNGAGGGLARLSRPGRRQLPAALPKEHAYTAAATSPGSEEARDVALLIGGS